MTNELARQFFKKISNRRTRVKVDVRRAYSHDVGEGGICRSARLNFKTTTLKGRGEARGGPSYPPRIKELVSTSKELPGLLCAEERNKKRER
jgi:hypothetical protein